MKSVQFISTRGLDKPSSFAEAILRGQPSDGGLFVPTHFPQISAQQMQVWKGLDFPALAGKLMYVWLQDEFAEKFCTDLAQQVFSFPLPLVNVTPQHAVLELFHGPTFSFKDFGARFLAAILKHVLEERKSHATIVTATSGDTGSAVADAFCGHERIKVFVFYPQGRISEIQRHQIALKRKNVFPIALEGSFDDCQVIVKKLLADVRLQHFHMSSANSINIGRLLAQTFYYSWLALQYLEESTPLVVVPSGNFGNVTAGLFASKMGFHLHFMAAVNANKVVLDFYQSKCFSPKPSVATLSSAMDVGNPSNFERIKWLFADQCEAIQRALPALSVSDAETLSTIADVWQKYSYQLDPHGAVAWKVAEDALLQGCAKQVISLATAHPAKFPDAMQKACGISPTLPTALQKQLQQPLAEVTLPNDYQLIRNYLESAY